MKGLKTILVTIYPILVVLLLLANMKACKSDASSDTTDDAEPTEKPVEKPDEQPADTADAVRQAERVGGNGALKVTLLWDFEGDIDLHVVQPNGKEIFFDRTIDETTGGALDVDNLNGGSGSAENIYWANPPKGEYRVGLVYYQPSKATGIAGVGICKVVVFQEGIEPQTYTTQMSIVKEEKNIVTIKIN